MSLDRLKEILHLMLDTVILGISGGKLELIDVLLFGV